ncbi:MAG: hypothetical protein HIU90_05505 [Proteobacteria bacterium]|nr:hypothetical protein [Pseudomonadota bacterium]
MMAQIVLTVRAPQPLWSHPPTKPPPRNGSATMTPALARGEILPLVGRMVSEDVYRAQPAISPKAFENALALQIFIGNIKPGQVTFEDAVEPAFAK